MAAVGVRYWQNSSSIVVEWDSAGLPGVSDTNRKAIGSGWLKPFTG